MRERGREGEQQPNVGSARAVLTYEKENCSECHDGYKLRARVAARLMAPYTSSRIATVTVAVLRLDCTVGVEAHGGRRWHYG